MLSAAAHSWTPRSPRSSSSAETLWSLEHEHSAASHQELTGLHANTKPFMPPVMEHEGMMPQAWATGTLPAEVRHAVLGWLQQGWWPTLHHTSIE